MANLKTYREKRDFSKTPEPGPELAKNSGNSFVVQEHHARTHHFDFRLEIDGVLVSWAVPKGIPEDFDSKRLAVHVEDHPLEYGKFEGIIPKGNYGAGTVAIWDKGEWEPLFPQDWRKNYNEGKIEFLLKGARLDGVWVIFRTKEPNWILKKVNKRPPADPHAKPDREQARFISPQLAKVVPTVPSGNEWSHELKFDGYRLIAVKREGEVRMFTRNGHDWTERFRVLASHLTTITRKDFVLDGEAVVFDEKGRTNFGDLQSAITSDNGGLMTFIAFDILHLDGMSLRDLPLLERQGYLAAIVSEDRGPVMRSRVWPAAEGKALFEQACKHQLEGIISKNSEGRYLEGARRDWSKSKCRPKQEFVICGYTLPKSSLPAFSALLLASFENGKLVPRGRVGTGFTDKSRLQLLDVFKPLLSKQPLWTGEDKDVVWLKPQLVAEVQFAEITREGSIRQGSFISLREDKAASEVHLDGLQVATSDNKGAKVAGMVISHPERLVYPSDHISKMEVARYYERVGELMLPYVANRPLAIIRAPKGITGEMFFQKNFTTHVPPSVHQRPLEDGNIFFVKNVKGLVALAQFGAIEIHPWGATLPKADRPSFLTWDLDPDDAVPWNEVLGTALLLRDFLTERGLGTMVKTSGGKGLHIVLHLKPVHGWDTLKAFSKRVSEAIVAYNPKRLTITPSKSKRTGKIFIDWMRNARGATCIAPWGLRARPGAPISMPIDWQQLPGIAPATFTIHEPPQTPSEWLEMKPQVISKTVLKEFGL